MAGFMARQLKKGLFEIVGLERYLEQRFTELKTKMLGKSPATSVAKPVPAKAKAPTQVKAKSPAKAAKKPKVTALAQDAGLRKLLGILAKHPRKAELVRSGKEKDQLRRSLIPLYLSRQAGVVVNSGMISRFWKANGLTYAQPNAAKALRQHVGYARKTKAGLQITPNGVKYVELALKKAA